MRIEPVEIARGLWTALDGLAGELSAHLRDVEPGVAVLVSVFVGVGTGSPEQPDLIHRGPAGAEGGCERQRALGAQPVEACRDEARLMARARPEPAEGGAMHDAAARYDRRSFGAACGRAVCPLGQSARGFRAVWCDRTEACRSGPQEAQHGTLGHA